VTYALATQLVVSLDGPLSEDGARDLAAIWAELAEFGEQIEGVPLAELRDRLTEFEERILAVVRADAERSGTTEESVADPTAPEAGTPSESGAPATGSAGATRSGTSATPTGAAATTRATSSGGASTETTAPAPTSSAPATETSSGTYATSTG
jgi:putative peptide zinc metalloprotease protein